MSKKILSLDLGITSIGYSVLEEKQNDRYSLIDYGVSMFDKATDKDGNSKKLLHSASVSTSNLYALRKKRKINLAKIFEEFSLGNPQDLLNQEKQNLHVNKWQLRCEKAFKEKLNANELFSIFYTLAKHRGYKSLDSSDLLEELCVDLNIQVEQKKIKKDDEKGKIKKALKTIENLKIQYPKKTVASIIYEEELKNSNPTFRNHDNYNYMIRREYIDSEIETIVKSQEKFGFFIKTFDIDKFIKELKEIITKQKESSNNLNLFGKCEFYKEQTVAHQYSLLSDIYKMYQNVSNIVFNKKISITKEEIKLVVNDFFERIKKGKSIPDIKYKDIRKILNLSNDKKIFDKEDSHFIKGKKSENTVIKFHFVNNLSKIDNNWILEILDRPNKYELLKEIFDILHEEKSPQTIYERLKDKIKNEKTIIDLIRYKSGNSMSISSFAMVKLLPYFEDGFTLDEIKQKLELDRVEDYSDFDKGIKYLHVRKFENDDKPDINNHPVKYAVSATLRLVKHLHIIYGVFDEIRVESTRELSQNEQTKKDIDRANTALEKQIEDIVENTQYQKIAEHYGKNLRKYARKIILWEEQERFDIYTGKSIGFEDIFTNVVDLDHIVPQSLGGLSVKHNFVLTHRDTNSKKSNQLPLNFISNKEAYKNRVEHLFEVRKINWKKKINLLATNLDEIFKDRFESKSLRATSYIEALTAQILKRYYPFSDDKKQKNGNSVRHVQGRATSNIRKLLHVKTKNRDTNIHHAIDAILIGVTNQSWLQKLSNTFRENMGIIDDEARSKIKKDVPYIDGMEVKDIVKEIEENYNFYGEDSVFYKDIWGKIKTINFWVSKKPMVSKIHKDTIYSKKKDGIYTVRENIINNFVALKTTVETKPDDFMKKFKKEILEKMYIYKTNPNDIICQIIRTRASNIVGLLNTFVWIDIKDKEAMSEAKIKLDELVHSPLVDNNGNVIKKVKFYQTNLTGFDIRGGLATKEKTFIGLKAILIDDKLGYERIDVANFERIKKENDNSFKVFKNDLVFFIYPNGDFKGGKIVSFLEDKKMGAFSNPRFPASYKFQPNSFCKDKAHSGAKQNSVGSANGIIKLNLDILGNVKSYQVVGTTNSDILNFIKDSIK